MCDPCAEVESNSQNMISAIQQFKGMVFILHQKEFYIDPFVLFFSQFRFCCFLFQCPRDCNNVAHALAVIAASQHESRLLWREDMPNYVRVLMAAIFLRHLSNGIRCVPSKKERSIFLDNFISFKMIAALCYLR
jgi:hypothetical protein